MVEVKGKEKIVKFLENFSEKLFDSVMNIVKRESSDSRNNILKDMRDTPKSSNVVKRKSVTHHPSLPGNAPAIDIGQLAKSITIESKNNQVQFGTEGTEYAQFLEDKNKLNRPFIEPEYKNIIPRLDDSFKKMGIGNL